MKTTDPNILKEFMTVLNRKHLTEELYQALLKRWDLDKIEDLDKEMEKINQHKSNLSKSRREAVPQFLQLRKLLDEKNNMVQSAMSLNNEMTKPNLANDTLTNF